MGRYTSQQTFNDQNTQIVGGYAGGVVKDAGAAADSGAGNSREFKKQKLEVDKVIMVI